MSTNRISRRHFFYGSLLAGVIPAGGYGTAQSLKALGYTGADTGLDPHHQ